MIQPGTQVIVIQPNGSPVAEAHGTPAMFSFQEFHGNYAEMLDEDGDPVLISVHVAALIRPVTAKMRSDIISARDEAEKGKQKHTQIAVPPNMRKH